MKPHNYRYVSIEKLLRDGDRKTGDIVLWIIILIRLYDKAVDVFMFDDVFDPLPGLAWRNNPRWHRSSWEQPPGKIITRNGIAVRKLAIV